MATVDEVRALALSLPRTEEVVVRDRLKFRVGRLVYIAFSRDERTMGIAFPRDERAAAVAADPETFVLPAPSDLRYNWIDVRLAALSDGQLRELVIEAWRMVVPKGLAARHLARPDETS